MDSKENTNAEDSFGRAMDGGPVSRRWLLRSTANFAAGSIIDVSTLGAEKAASRPASAIDNASKQHDPHTNNESAYNSAAFEGWESV